MALTVLIKLPGDEDDSELALTLDAPRIVIGRSRGCEVLLPDPTVSPRHASIRQRGGENIIVDEGSTNGILVGSVKLPPQTPRAVRDRELVRVGRVWLELRTGLGVPSTPQQAQTVALRWLRQRLAADGEPMVPTVRVVDGPDEGTELALADPDREYVIGRSPQADLTLDDASLSRRHASVRRQGAEWLARDLGSKRGGALGDEPLAADGAPWRDGARLCLGQSTLELHDPLPEALAELLRAPDERMSPREFTEPPPGAPADAATEVVTAPEEPAPVSEDLAADALARADAADEELEPIDEAEHGGALVSTLIVVVALAVLGVSVAGLVWLLGG
jgi:pSer/pThr/pTyr-binding forkhead associated (FHA) protein